MNLNSLSTSMMINLTERWLGEPSFRAALEGAGPLGIGILNNLEKVHMPLTDLQNNRAELKDRRRGLSGLARRFDRIHRRKARAVFYLLRSLIEGADNDEEADDYRVLLKLLFPIGLAVTKLPHIEAGGSVVVLQRAVKPAIRARLEAIQVGPRRLIDLFDQWMEAGNQIGRIVQQRADLAAASAHHGSEGESFDIKTGRNQWIRGVHALLWSLKLESSLAQVREGVVEALQRAIATARRRSAAGAEAEVLEEEAEGDEATDSEAEDDADGDSEDDIDDDPEPPVKPD